MVVPAIAASALSLEALSLEALSLDSHVSGATMTNPATKVRTATTGGQKTAGRSRYPATTAKVRPTSRNGSPMLKPVTIPNAIRTPTKTQYRREGPTIALIIRAYDLDVEKCQDYLHGLSAPAHTRTLDDVGSAGVVLSVEKVEGGAGNRRGIYSVGAVEIVCISYLPESIDS